jgi:hypothetical protein
MDETLLETGDGDQAAVKLTAYVNIDGLLQSCTVNAGGLNHWD